jgi:aryl-alcohol dehydrogenase-like predicted oxidoreductase
MMNAVEASLRRLQSDHIDLSYVHRWDESTPVEETLRALDDLIRSGKVRYIGASQFAAWRLAHANLLAELRGWSRFVVLQSEYHMLERHVEHDVLLRRAPRGFVPTFLAGGFLTGKYQRGNLRLKDRAVNHHRTSKIYDRSELRSHREARGVGAGTRTRAE